MKLSAVETAAMIVLMVEGDEVLNSDLAKQHGIKLTPRHRKNLNDLKLVETRPHGRTMVHVLTDKGWARLADEFREGVAASPGATGGALRSLAFGVARFMGRTDHRLGDLFQPEPPAEGPEGPGGVEGRVRGAYTELAREPGGWVSLTDLRRQLSELPRDAVDDALRSLNRQPDVVMVPEDNQKALRAEDREAALVISDQHKHYLAIGAR
ncbi:hypothetical protein GCM10010404_37770 [Nonomuraea africana]|uniref:MarR family transcriptional regulator n=1 Tax=Nonomuraea africana TaxID=46171 RepID=A0ABR9KS67_9ACTN|nr:hypothetical protein [Nonomuraea africana]MBE1564875.1 hypothetical protein [Nonomuraea africana]